MTSAIVIVTLFKLGGKWILDGGVSSSLPGEDRWVSSLLPGEDRWVSSLLPGEDRGVSLSLWTYTKDRSWFYCSQSTDQLTVVDVLVHTIKWYCIERSCFYPIIIHNKMQKSYLKDTRINLNSTMKTFWDLTSFVLQNYSCNNYTHIN